MKCKGTIIHTPFHDEGKIVRINMEYIPFVDLLPVLVVKAGELDKKKIASSRCACRIAVYSYFSSAAQLIGVRIENEL